MKCERDGCNVIMGTKLYDVKVAGRSHIFCSLRCSILYINKVLSEIKEALEHLAHM